MPEKEGENMKPKLSFRTVHSPDIMRAKLAERDKKAYQKAYLLRSEVRARKKAYQKAYNLRPEVRARMKAYYLSHEGKNRKHRKMKE